MRDDVHPAFSDRSPAYLDGYIEDRAGGCAFSEPDEEVHRFSAPAVGAPGGVPGVYSNTNYLLLCQLLEHVTGTTAEKCIIQNVIERAGLRDTELPAGPYVNGPHSQIYEAWFGMIEPPRDYSVYDMSWVGPAASLHKIEVPGHGTFWGHDGTVWGAGAISMTRADGKRQMSVAVNLMRWNKLDASGRPQPHPLDDALPALYRLAMCGNGLTKPAER